MAEACCQRMPNSKSDLHQRGTAMGWRTARLNLDVLAVDAVSPFEREPVLPAPTSETSLLHLLKQRFCSDEELAEQLQSGETDALTILFRRHSAVLFGVARRILRNDADAEDAVQRIFLDVFRSIQQFDPDKGTFKTWLLMFAYHRTFNSRRSQIASKVFDTDQLDENLTEASLSCSGAENGILVDQVMKSLQPRQRRTIELIYYEGLTAEEVSIRTGESVRVVRHNLYRGMEKLRKLFRDRTIAMPRHKEDK